MPIYFFDNIVLNGLPYMHGVKIQLLDLTAVINSVIETTLRIELIISVHIANSKDLSVYNSVQRFQS